MNDIYARIKSVQDRINSISSDILYSKDGVEHVEKKCLSDIADLVNNSVSPMNNRNTLYKHYSIPAFVLDKCPALEYRSEIDSGKYLIPDGAILVSKLKSQFKRVWVPEKYDDVSICSTEFMPFVAKNRKQRGFLYSVVNGPAFQQYIIQCSSSSTGSRKRMQPELCGAFSFQCLTDSFILEKYNVLFESVFELERLAINFRKLTDRYQAFINLLINENVILFR